jgi:hypothetical protein
VSALLALALGPPPAVPATDPPPAGENALATVPGIRDRTGDAPLARLFEKADPNRDEAWESESLSASTEKQLKQIAAAFADPASLTEDALQGIVSPRFASPTGFRPALREVFNDGSLAVMRPAAGAGHRDGATGLAAFRAGLGALLEPFEITPERPGRAKFKTVRVAPAEGGGGPILETGVYFESAGSQPGGTAIGQTATFDLTWDAADPEHPLLAGLSVVEFEEVVQVPPASGARPVPLFADATAALLGGEASFREQLAHGADHWYANLDVTFGIHQGNHGVAVGDADGDGRDDLFLCQPAGLPSKLYLRRPDGTLRDATAEAGLDWLDNSRSALFADIDSDGDQDLALTLSYSLTLHENLGGGKFELRVAVDINSWPSSVAAADYDNDGDLDFYVCGYNPRGETAPGDIFANPVPYHDANNGARNFLVENLGGFEFADATERAGLNANNRRFSFAAGWEDYDDDGDQDLYVANDFGRNNLYRNEGPAGPAGAWTFTDVAAEAEVEDIAAGMSVSWGDPNRDGRMDVYVSNMFSSAGNRITFQRQFKAESDDATRANLQRHARGNTLFENAGDGTFRDTSVEAGVTMGRWAWGSHFVDLNSDSWEDLYVANGFFTTADSGDL